MLAGVLFHAALAYSPLTSRVSPTADRQHSAWVDVVEWGPHLVRMPLFFLVAGSFAGWTLERCGGVTLARLPYLPGLPSRLARRRLLSPRSPGSGPALASRPVLLSCWVEQPSQERMK